jgi:putative GTP pyrophosphokinase
MGFSPVPKESIGQINKAGKILAEANPPPDQFAWALELAEQWRACHAYPINTFQARLRLKLRQYSEDSFAAQRLKRMPTIIDKLKRFPEMNLARMQDIGGIRAVVPSVSDLYRLADDYRNNRRFTHELVGQRDYVANPRSDDGYRSLHLIYRYRNRRAPEYDGLRLELQIRTKLQHAWATAVETMGTFLGQALKSRQGDQQWLDFFALISSAFAHKENCSPVPRFSHLSAVDTFKAVADANAKLGALAKMRGFSVAANEIVKRRGTGKSWHYHLIVLDSLAKTVHIRPYDRDSFNRALADYSRTEAEAAEGKKIEPVLVSAGPIDQLRKAYPNFFLDIKEFSEIVRGIISTAKAGHL